MDKYARVKKIGEGSFGKALLVRCKANGKQMVVKEINMNKMQRKEREEARKEVAVLSQLDHPNIVSYKESFEEIGNLYIVMDYCDAGDLYGKINQQRGILFMEDQVLDWFVQTCLAIKHIHDRKILHRDIKSQNIFLTRHGIVKLGDFGIAKVLNSTVELARTCIGTPYYLSPEICENKPYNNKSDIWSLGCVLYELATLKHAFEAGNMKNLVLKIIRGSYPPPPPRYSYEMRSLISQLFKRSPRDRPSINSVLKKPLLQIRIKKFLSENEVKDEFSHTVMHGVKIKKQIPAGGARPLPPKPQPVNRAPSPQQAKYNPVSVYGPSVAKKSANKENRKSAEVRRSGGGNVKRPLPSPAGNHIADLNKRRQELLDKERRRREEAKKREQEAQQHLYAKRHQNLVDKQKAARINRAREDGWRGMMDSLSSDDSDKFSPRGNDPPKVEVKPATPKPAQKDRGNYDQYHAYLDQLQQDRQGPNAVPNRPALGVAGAMAGGAYGGGAAGQAAKHGAAAGAKGADAADRARLLGEYMQRKNQAAVNKARAHGDIYGAGAAGAVSPRVNAPKPKTPTPTPSAGRPASARDSRESRNAAPSVRQSPVADKNEEDYLSKLRQIRLQNFNERRNVKDKLAGGKVDPKYKPPVDPRQDVDVRRKKIEALKMQADDRAKKLREELEKKRKDAYEFEQKRLKDQAKVRPAVSAQPAAPIPMTEAMRAIGVVKEEPKPVSQMEKCPIGMTAAMEAIGAAPAVEKDETRLSMQQKKVAILKRINKKPPVPEKPEKPDKPDRPKWGEPVKPAVAVPDRPKWAAADAADVLKGKSLEETGSHMEATNAGDIVVKHVDIKNEPEASDDSAPVSSRRQWGGRATKVLNVFQEADLADSGTLKSDSSEATSPSQQPTPVDEAPQSAEEQRGKAPAIGTTITIARGAGKGTVIIKKADSPPDNTEKTAAVPAKQEISESGSQPTSTSSSPTLKVKTTKKSRSRSSSPKPKEDAKSQLFSRVELNEDKGTKIEERLVVEDLDEEENTPVGSVKEEKSKPQPITEPDHEKEAEPIAEKVVLSDEENEPILSRSLKEAGLVLGLTTGHFDTDITLLRTCSEPDLAKLFRTNLADNPFFDEISALNLSSVDEILAAAAADEDEDDLSEGEKDEDEEAGDDDDDDEGATAGLELYEPNFDEDEDSGKDEDDEAQEEDVQEDSEEEDIETMRESMRNLLETQDLKEGEEPLDTTAKRKAKKGAKKGKKPKKRKTKDTVESSTSRSISRQWSDSSVKDLQSMRETMQTLIQPAPAKEKKLLKSIKEQGAGDADKSGAKEDTSTLLNISESWQSDNDDDDDYFEEEDMFSRLEANRANLEQELGCELFMKAYKTVQDSCKEAIHEDEDDNMEEGIQLISTILGHEKIHLYPSILQLVMADGVFTEDND